VPAAAVAQRLLLGAWPDDGPPAARRGALPEGEWPDEVRPLASPEREPAPATGRAELVVERPLPGLRHGLAWGD